MDRSKVEKIVREFTTRKLSWWNVNNDTIQAFMNEFIERLMEVGDETDK